MKDLSGSGSKHDPLSVSYVVIGGLYYAMSITVLWLKLNPIVKPLPNQTADTKRKLKLFINSQ